MIHAYSLVHDDLPAMDDDDLRRGRPTTHRVFGEAAAIMAGNALLTFAFELLASRPAGPAYAERRSAAVAVAARRCGVEGLIGGQIADLEAERAPADPARLDWIHLHKTGALFAGAAEIGAIRAGADDRRRAALARFGETLGLAFQIADDLLDRSGSAELLGKTPGKDLRDEKATYPALHGPAESRRRADELTREARASLEAERLLTPALDHLAGLFVSRTH
jgi:geranylgeranyl diphosphate synthase type II